jgi:hypothetical protein
MATTTYISEFNGQKIYAERAEYTKAGRNIDESLDSNTQVTQTADSSNTGNYPILAKNTTGTSTITDTSRFNANISLTPSTGTMNATAFNVATHCKMEYNSTDRSLDFNFS